MSSNIQVKWDESDIEDKIVSKITSVKITSNKSFQGPLRATNITKTTSEKEMYSNYSLTPLPSQKIFVYYTKFVPETFNNLRESNGKFNKRRTEARTVLLKESSKDVIRILYPRIPRTYKENKKHIPITKISPSDAEAAFDFLTDIPENDIIIPTIPPALDDFNVFKNIIDSFKESYETINSRKPFMGYIPRHDNPKLIEKMTKYYIDLDMDVKLFGIDFANGHFTRTMNQITRTLIREMDEDYYIHGFNIPHSDNNRDAIATVHDLYAHTIGVDGFNNTLYGGGGKRPSKENSKEEIFNEFKSKIRYMFRNDYGEYRYYPLKNRLKEKEFDDCNCPICKKEEILKTYKEDSYTKLIEKLRVHRLYNLAVEEDIIKNKIKEGKLHKYMFSKEVPNRSGFVRQMYQEIGFLRGNTI